VAAHVDALAREGADLRRRIAAGDDERQRRALADARHDLARQIERRVEVGLVVEAADEEQTGAWRVAGRILDRMLQGRDDQRRAGA